MSDYAAMAMEDSKLKRFLRNAADFYQHNFFVLHPNFDYCHKEGKEKWSEDKIRTFHILQESEHLGSMREVHGHLKTWIKEETEAQPSIVIEAIRNKVKELAREDASDYLAKASKQVDRKTFEQAFDFYFSRDIGNHLQKSYDQELKFIRHLAQQQVREAEDMFKV